MGLKHLAPGLVIAVSVFLAACDQESPATGAEQAAQQSAAYQQRVSDYKVSNVAWLKDRLPARTLAYVRLPLPWDLLNQPKGDILHPIQEGQAHRQQLASIRTAMIERYSNMLPEHIREPFALMIGHVDSPLEMAVLEPNDGSAVPNVVLGTTLSGYDHARFGELLNSLIERAAGQVRIITPYNDEGLITMVVGPAPLYVKFSEADGRLLLASGLSASDELIKGFFSREKIDVAHYAVTRFENSIDVSGRHLAAWVDVDGLYDMMSYQLNAEQKRQLQLLEVDEMDFLWMGTASRNGQSEFVIHLAMPETGLRLFTPRLNQSLNLKVAGTVDWAGRLAIPTLEQFNEAYEFVLALNPESDLAARGTEIKAAVDQWLGFDVGNYLRAYGPEITTVSDESGTWTAYQLRDPAIHREIVARLESKLGTTVQTSSLAGVPIKHWSLATNQLLSGLDPDQSEEPVDPFTQQMLSIYNGFHSHLYWLQEGDYLIFSAVPQVLADRANHDTSGTLKEWLDGNGLDWNTSILGLATTLDHLPRGVYHAYLQVLLLLGDLAGHEVDLFALPTATEAGLPDTGRLGLSMDASEDALTLRLSYNYSMLETLGSGSGTLLGVAVVGILAAIAVPAYQDYQMRSRVVLHLADASRLRYQLVLFYLENNRLPNQREVEDIMASMPDTLDYDVDEGIITLTIPYEEADQIAGQTIEYYYQVDDANQIDWICTAGTIDPRYLPGVCR